ncbi:MAG: MFS transporter [Anaerolineae bacterium]|nr:MFS transporter [Anaerolineae bacterium]
MALYMMISVLIGTYLGLRGATLPNVAQQVNVGIGEIGIIITSGSTGLLLANILAASIFDQVKGHKIFALSAFLTMVGTAAIPMITTIAPLVILTFFIGAAGGLLLMGVNTLPLWISNKNSGMAMNAIQFSSGIGQLAGPLLASATLPIDGTVKWSFWICAAGFAIILPMSVLIKSPPIRQVHQPSDHSNKLTKLNPMERKVIILLAVFMLVYLGGEVSFASWITTFAQSQLPPIEINKSYTVTSIFWGFMIFGRLLSTVISSKVKSRQILTFDMIGIILSLVIIVFSAGHWTILIIGTALLGLSMSSFFASVFNYAEELMPVTGRLSSILMMGASVGAIVFPVVLGKILANSDPINIMVALLMMMVFSGGIFFYLNLSVVRK